MWLQVSRPGGHVLSRRPAQVQTGRSGMEADMFLWIIIGLAVVFALIAWAGRRRGTAKASDPGLNGRVKNATLRNQSRGDFY